MAESILQTRQLTKQYGHALALDHVDMHLEKGQIYGLVGKNGAGKTTLMRLITAQSYPTSGEIVLFGRTEPDSVRRMRTRIGGNDRNAVVLSVHDSRAELGVLQDTERHRRQKLHPRSAGNGGSVGYTQEKVQKLFLGDETAAGLGAGRDGAPGFPGAG